MNNTINDILGNSALAPPPIFDNWMTAFLWLVTGIVIFAMVALYVNFKKGLAGKKVNKGALPFIKWPLLLASAGFNVFFTYYVFLPAGQAVAVFSAVVMGGVNLAEAYLVRLIIASWRHDMKVVFKMALIFTVPVFMYSLMAAGSAFNTMMNKNKDTMLASQLEIQSAGDRIKQAQAQVQEAKTSADNGNLLMALYQTDVQNSRGGKVGFNQVKGSCESGGYYSIQYPDLCNQYRNLSNGSYTAQTVAQAQTQALATSANEKLQMAKIIKDRPPQITPTLLGFALGFSMVGFIVSLALESAIIGVGFFEELFVKPTPLPAIVSFQDKSLDWDANSITQKGLQIDIAPSPGTVSYANNGTLSSPFSSIGWKPSTSVQKALHATVQENTETALESGLHASVQGESVPVQKEVSAQRADSANTQTPAEKADFMKGIIERFERAKDAKVGDNIECAMCGTETKKRIDTKRFCSARCRYEYRNLTKD